MDFNHTKNVEKAVQCSARICDIDRLPMMGNTGSFKIYPIYYNDDNMKQ